MKIKFKRDTSFRKQFFVPDSFAHPAKMDAQLLLWIVNKYSEAGETILDPMAGSGTTMLACTLGRDVVLIELEDKFCKMIRDNWEQVKMRPQLGSTMGECKIIQGDARQLETVIAGSFSGRTADFESVNDGSTPSPATNAEYSNGRKPVSEIGGEGSTPSSATKQLEGLVDKIVTSPPYANIGVGQEASKNLIEERIRKGIAGATITEDGRYMTGNGKYLKEYSPSKDNIGNLPYGEIDKCIFSPPYAEAHDKEPGGVTKTDRKDLLDYSYLKEDNPDNVGNLPYGQIDKIVTSPPYANRIGDESDNKGHRHFPGDNNEKYMATYPVSEGQIGNLKSQSYLEAMLQVYQQCYGVLKPQGLMILVTKNFIRNKAVVRLDTDTIKLCEQAGFSFVERHYRELPSQSFWRVIYHQKFPDVEQIKNEDVLVFVK